MDRPSSSMTEPSVVSPAESKVGDDHRTVDAAARAMRSGNVVVAAFGNPVAVDYAAFVVQRSPSDLVVVADDEVGRLVEVPVRTVAIDAFCRSTARADSESGRMDSLILFLGPRFTPRQRGQLDDLIAVARRCRTRFVAIISTFRVHLDDPEVTAVEDDVVARATNLFERVLVVRPGHVVSRHSPVVVLLERLAPFFPLVPTRLSTCFVEGNDLFGAIEAERLDARQQPGSREPWRSGAMATFPPFPGRPVGIRNRAFTLLGANRSWRDMLVRHRGAGLWQYLATAVSTVLSWLLVGQALAFVFTLFARRSPWLRQWNVQTLRPRSLRELLSLCHPGNIAHVRVVGYNNGVAHFGHRHPGKTIVSTVRCHRMAFAGPNTLKADSGATVRNALDFLAQSQQELYVVPNYSYVSLGTSFFVPIHGSAVEYSTVADTIRRVVLYDPDSDRIIAAGRNDAAFREHVYNQESRAVLLRLYILAKPKSRYFVHRETLENPSAAQLLAALSDSSATNVEIRQAHAASARVTVSRYYTDLAETSSPALELPRDALGRLWDRLEENPVTSYLMHALSRHVAWHTELFFTPAQFDVFWRTHGQLPSAQNTAKVSEARRLDVFSLSRRRLRFGRSLHVPQEQAPVFRLSPDDIHNRSEPTPANIAINLACTTNRPRSRPVSRSCVSRSRISFGCI